MLVYMQACQEILHNHANTVHRMHPQQLTLCEATVSSASCDYSSADPSHQVQETISDYEVVTCIEIRRGL
jgi:hypothetical protein